MKNIKIYLRSNSNNVSKQLEEIKEFIDMSNVADIYIDLYKSGNNANRQNFNEMLNKLEPNDVVIVHSLDRLTRDAVKLYEIMNKIEKKGAKLISVSSIQKGSVI